MKAAFHTLGCKVNQYETEAIKEQFRALGWEIGDEEEFQAIFGKDLIYQRAAYEVEDSPYGMSGIPMALCVPNGDISAFGFDMVGKLTQGYG